MLPLSVTAVWAVSVSTLALAPFEAELEALAVLVG